MAIFIMLLSKRCLEVSIFIFFMNGTRAENKARKVIIITSSYRFFYTFSLTRRARHIVLLASKSKSIGHTEWWAITTEQQGGRTKRNPCFIILLRIHNQISKGSKFKQWRGKVETLLIRYKIYAIAFWVYRYLLAFFPSWRQKNGRWDSPVSA